MRRNSPLVPGRRKVRPKVPDAVRAEVKARTHGRCALCLRQRGYTARRIAHLHHIFPTQRWPELAKEPANLIGLCHEHHFAHEFAPGQRIPREALPAEAIALAEGDGPMRNELDRRYPSASEAI